MCKAVKRIADMVETHNYTNLGVSVSKLRGEVHLYLKLPECDMADLNDTRLLTIFVTDDHILDMEHNSLIQWMMTERGDVVVANLDHLACIYEDCDSECNGGITMEEKDDEEYYREAYLASHGVTQEEVDEWNAQVLDNGKVVMY